MKGIYKALTTLMELKNENLITTEQAAPIISQVKEMYIKCDWSNKDKIVAQIKELESQC